MHNPAFQVYLAEYFIPEDVQQIVAFIKDFSPNGEILLVCVFLYAQEHKKKLADVLAVCKQEWERNWKLQRPDVRGDPDGPFVIGKENNISLENVCRIIGIPNPGIESKKIPMGSFVVKTCHSTYKIGPANENGERNITRVEKPLPFDICRITFLAEGKFMQFVPIGSDSKEPWTTSAIESVKLLVKASGTSSPTS